MRAADCEKLPASERPFWYKPRPRGHAGAIRTALHDVQMTPFAMSRLKRALRLKRYLDGRNRERQAAAESAE